MHFFRGNHQNLVKSITCGSLTAPVSFTMKFSNAVFLLILGSILSANGSVLQFNPEDSANLIAALSGVKEVDQLNPQSFISNLGVLRCEDEEGGGTEITKVEDGSSFIKISPTSREYTVVYVKELDYEVVSEDLGQQNKRKVSIRCSSLTDASSILFEANLVVLDVNDNKPVFDRSNETYRTRIDEFLDESTLPLLIYSRASDYPIKVFDADGSPNNNIVTAECVGMRTKSSGLNEMQSCDGYFSVEAVNYEFGRYHFNIYALRADYSGEDSYILIIKAINIPNLPTEQVLNSTTQNVNINIQDLQNLPPSIDKDLLSFTMYEDLIPGNRLDGFIAAFDQDIGDPHPIRFEIVAPDQTQPSDLYAFNQDLFMLGNVSVDPQRPKFYRVPILVKNPVDREAITDITKTLYLGIKAIEYDPQNRPNRQKGTAQETFTIKIEDVNDMAPTFNQQIYYINITELASGTPNPDNFRQISNNIDIQVDDTDSSLYNQYTINIISGNTGGNFKLDKNTGSGLERISLFAKERILDYEVTPNSYTVQLQAVDTDQKNKIATATVVITIIDANDHSPEFADVTAVFNIQESQNANTVIGSVVATDSDSGNFGIISEYTIIGDDSETFSIDNQGTLRLVKGVDFETRNSYYFTVVAYDSGVGNNRRDGSININVQILNVPDVGPEFVAAYTSTLREESYTLIPQITVQAESREAVAGVINYSIVSVQPSTISQTAFTIDRLTGKLSVGEFINYKSTSADQPGIVKVTISAEAGGLTSNTVATITIIDINNFAPEFIPRVQGNIYRTSITELARPGDEVFDLDVEDKDGADSNNGRVTFQIQSGANDDFLITADSGIIKVTNSANLDIEDNQKNYTIVVLARDKGASPKSASATVIVDLTDSNNKDPVFKDALYRFQMNADDPVDKTIGTVIAEDSDGESSLRYSINYNSINFEKQSVRVENIDITVNKVVKIEPTTGEIKVAGLIRREEYDRINLNVIVEDVNIDPAIQSRQTASASVVIFILAAIDPSIYFTNDGWDKVDETIGVTFTESKARQIQIMTLRAIDPEIPANINTYRKAPGSDPDDYFQVDGASVFIKKPLDYEALPPQKQASVVVEAISDNGQKTGTATIVVSVQDLNDNAPIFEKEKYEFTVAEDKKAPYIVGRAKATDLDSTSYGQVDYSLIGAQGDFDIYMERSGTENEAVIYVAENAELDFETKPLYNLVLVASDNTGGSNTVKFVTNVDVEIVVEDRNDMSPEFAEAVYNISIVGTKEVGGDVFYIRAQDGDAGMNGQMEYFIIDSTNSGSTYFGIDTVDQASDVFGEVLQVGRIFVRSSLENLPDRAMFVLTVNARDRGNPPTLPGSCKVIITVSKGVQDLKPKWDEQLPARVQIAEEQPINTYVAQLKAYPADVTSKIVYSFVRAGDALRDYDSFSLNPNTGEIRTKVVLDYEEQRIYNRISNDITLLILATDSVNDTLTNQYLLIVQILDVDDNKPSFADCPGKVYSVPETARVDEELPPEVYVYRAEACDLDDPPLNRVRYTWFIDNNFCSADNLNVFTLNENTGQVYTKVSLDRETTSEYMLCIEASRTDVENTERGLQALNQTNKLLFVKVTVNDRNDLGPKFYEPAIKKVILQYPATDISVAEAYDSDQPPNNGIRYSIANIDFTIGGKTHNAPTAFTINANDGTIVIGTNDYSDYVGGYFDITVKAEDNDGANVPHDSQLQRVYVTDRSNRIRVVFDEPADAGVDQKAKNMIKELNDKYEDSGMFFEIEKISYHVVSNNADPSFDKTDVCIVVVEEEQVLSAARATSRLTDSDTIQDTLEKYGAVDPGSCDPAVSVYPTGWESYWWVLVAFAIFIFICCIILIVLICVLYRQYRQYMDSRKTYLVQEN